MNRDHFFNIVIVGGGFSGAMVATNIIRSFGSYYRGARPICVSIIEPRESVGTGIAYGTRDPRHLLNVRAGNMSALADSPEDFVRWLKTHQPFESWSAPVGDIGDICDAYVPRTIYGRYVQDLLRSSIESAPAAMNIEVVHDEALCITPRGRAGYVLMRSGRVVRADLAVLAIGNLAPRDLPGLSDAFLQSHRYIRDPWSRPALAGLAADEAVLFVGAGLTTIDLAISLRAKGHQGQIHVVSRRGLFPNRHGAAPIIEPIAFPKDGPIRVSTLLKLIRSHSRDPESHGWRSVINSLRAATADIWRALPTVEKRRFLRHLQTYWDLHRHRMAPETADRISEMQSSGQLTIRAGRIIGGREKSGGMEVWIRERRSGRTISITVGRVINCTGASVEVRNVQHSLLRELLGSGLVRRDRLGLGLDVDDDGRCIDATGNRSGTIYTIGPVRKGAMWETTAVPEIRVQAANLARKILECAGMS
ncbi:MAG TPA: FAD/NAD(P)-binding protein [Blastocatellia bacterium]